MWKRLLYFLMPLLAHSQSKQPGPQAVPTLMDPNTILFTLPTLCDPAPAVDRSPIPPGAQALHEDDWRQIEFVTPENRAHISWELDELAKFKHAHSKIGGWTDVYLRKEHPTPFARLDLKFERLPKSAVSELTLGGQGVLGGFAFSNGRKDWFVYGRRTPAGHVLDLAISPSQSTAPTVFLDAVSKIATSHHLLLVDWYKCAIVDTSSPKTVQAWTRLYQR